MRENCIFLPLIVSALVKVVEGKDTQFSSSVTSVMRERGRERRGKEREVKRKRRERIWRKREEERDLKEMNL